MSCVKLISRLANKSLLQNNIIKGTIITSVRSKATDEPDWIPEDPVTHTGQHWDKDDYRLARFVGHPKQINTNFAIDLIEEVPPQVCTERVVWCDGGDDHTGHPRVYINLDKPGTHACGYCGLRYCREENH